MQPVEAAGVLHQRALPRDRQRQEQRVEPRVVEALADVPPRREEQSLLVVRDAAQLRRTLAFCSFRDMPPCSTTRWRTKRSSRSARNWRWSLRSVSRIGERPSCDRPDDVVEDQPVARLVGGELAVVVLDGAGGVLGSKHEAGLAHDQPVVEGPLRGLALRVDREPHRAELHLGDRVVPVAALRRRGQPDDVPRLDLG